MSIAADRWLELLKAPEPGSRTGSQTGDEPFLSYLRNSYDLPSDWIRIRNRYRSMVETHTGRFENPQLSVARAPGRVNLIGEHTDYNGLPVFPMAVNRDMAAAFAPRKDRKIVIINTESDFTERSFDIEQSIPPGATTARPRCRDCSTTMVRSDSGWSISAVSRRPSTEIFP